MTNWHQVCDDFARVGVAATCEAPLGARTTYRVGGTAAVVVEVSCVEDLMRSVRVIKKHHVQHVLVMGNGSNMLIADQGFDGLALVLRSLDVDAFSVDDDGVVTVGGHIFLPQMARQSVVAGRCGLEWAVGVPGTVGGAIRMNAGGHGSDMASSVVDVHIIDVLSGNHANVSQEDLGFRFRASALKDHHVVLSARLATSMPQSHHGRTCTEELSEIVRWRREFQPGGQNAGSVFVNPGNASMSAGALIDAAGLRGHRQGSAEVTMKHANFIQADPNGSAHDVVSLMCQVQDAVHEHCGIRLRSEIKLIGFADSLTGRFADPVLNDSQTLQSAAKLEEALRCGDQVS
jgi:UDP-N-acetylmuramate dehydrogenase